ncbi:MAG: hypothetical protein LBU70_00400 [Chitinispirillales bacterium]|nr:hypothetical protein [Chitinispirillales bacterium]
MKVVFTVTAIYDFPDDVELESLIEGGHVIIDGRKFQPFMDFTEFDEDGDKPEWERGGDEEELEEIYERLDEGLVAEEYTIMRVDEV